jgi:hypothetical protein
MLKRSVEPCRARRSRPTCARPSARRALADREPRPVPPYLRVVDESACENDWNSRLMPSATGRCRCRARRT